MIELNDDNGAALETRNICESLLALDEPLFGCEMGIALGGGIEKIGELWKGRGIVWGFDTFTGHPKEFAETCPDTAANGGRNAHAVWCMDLQYERYGNNFTYEDIRAGLDAKGLHNVCLVKGIVNERTSIDFIPKLHYVLLDMDYPLAMRHGYAAVRDKIVSGGYLCLHDVIPHQHIPGLGKFYDEIKAEGMWEVVSENPSSYLAILRKK